MNPDPLDHGIVDMVKRHNHTRETAINEAAVARINCEPARHKAANERQRGQVGEIRRLVVDARELSSAIRETMSPSAVEEIARHLETFKTASAEVAREALWFRHLLETMTGQ